MFVGVVFKEPVEAVPGDVATSANVSVVLLA
jgi:hypothetical protein